MDAEGSADWREGSDTPAGLVIGLVFYGRRFDCDTGRGFESGRSVAGKRDCRGVAGCERRGAVDGVELRVEERERNRHDQDRRRYSCKEFQVVDDEGFLSSPDEREFFGVEADFKET